MRAWEFSFWLPHHHATMEKSCKATYFCPQTPHQCSVMWYVFLLFACVLLLTCYFLDSSTRMLQHSRWAKWQLATVVWHHGVFFFSLIFHNSSTNRYFFYPDIMIHNTWSTSMQTTPHTHGPPSLQTCVGGSLFLCYTRTRAPPLLQMWVGGVVLLHYSRTVGHDDKPHPCLGHNMGFGNTVVSQVRVQCHKFKPGHLTFPHWEPNNSERSCVCLSIVRLNFL